MEAAGMTAPPIGPQTSLIAQPTLEAEAVEPRHELPPESHPQPVSEDASHEGSLG